LFGGILYLLTLNSTPCLVPFKKQNLLHRTEWQKKKYGDNQDWDNGTELYQHRGLVLLTRVFQSFSVKPEPRDVPLPTFQQPEPFLENIKSEYSDAARVVSGSPIANESVT
jgi:hypothetical protein